MFNTSTQLKAQISNLTQKTGIPQIVLQKRYMLDRFLERLSCSRYRKSFILKGGALISEMVGIAARATQDLDATVKGMPITADYMKNIISEISAVDVGDQISFSITSADIIMEDADYGGVRFGLCAQLQNMVVPIKIDISTGDAITPNEVPYGYKLMFEDRRIDIMAYPIETVLAEKIEAMLVRADTNSRMRDFYDMYILVQTQGEEIDPKTLVKALAATASKRKTTHLFPEAEEILTLLDSSVKMQDSWKQYQKSTSYAAEVPWHDVMWHVRNLCVESGLAVRKPSIRYMLKNPSQVGEVPAVQHNQRPKEQER